MSRSSFGGEAWPALAGTVSSVDLDLSRTAGFLVADARGRVVGRVERMTYGRSADTFDALLIRFNLLGLRRRRLIPASAIEAIDDRTRVVGLRINREAVQA